MQKDFKTIQLHEVKKIPQKGSLHHISCRSHDARHLASIKFLAELLYKEAPPVSPPVQFVLLPLPGFYLTAELKRCGSHIILKGKERNV